MGKNLSHAERKIADNMVRTGRADDICAARRRLQVAPSALPQPIVKNRFPGVEPRMFVRFRQKDRRSKKRQVVSHVAKAL